MWKHMDMMKGGICKAFMHLFLCLPLQCVHTLYFHRSVTLHTGFSVLVCTNQFFGDPIQCDLVSENIRPSFIYK